MTMTRDDLVEALRLHRGEIVEADEWRPLADHILKLVQMGYLVYETNDANVEKARGVLRGLRLMLEEQLEQQLYHAGDSEWKQPEETQSEIEGVDVGLRALNALAREPVLMSDLEQITELRDSAEERLEQLSQRQEVIEARIAYLERTPHTCPVCNGAKIVSRPPHVAGDVTTWSASSSVTYECKVCKGAGVLWAEGTLRAVLAAIEEKGVTL